MNGNEKVYVLLGRVYLIVGLVFFVCGFIIYGIFSTETKEKEALEIIFVVFVLIGVIFLILGTAFLFSNNIYKKKIETLKKNGLSYDCEIVKTQFNIYRNIGYRHPIIVECVYTDNNGKKCLVKSKNVWIDNPSDEIKAKIWVNPENPKHYHIEAYTENDLKYDGINYDYDYR